MKCWATANYTPFFSTPHTHFTCNGALLNSFETLISAARIQITWYNDNRGNHIPGHNLRCHKKTKDNIKQIDLRLLNKL